jgi:hypothetical protein
LPGLSDNTALPWSLELIGHFVDYWNWSFLSQNRSIPHESSEFEIIGRYYDYDWEYQDQDTNNAPLRNEALQPETLDRCKRPIDWFFISGNESLLLTLELIERYKDHWFWYELSQNKSLPTPALTSQDIEEVMNKIKDFV